MPKLIHPILALCAWSLGAAAEPAAMTQARQALAESVPGVGIFKLRAALASPTFPAPDRPEAILLLSRSLAAAGWYDEALKTLPPLTAESQPAATLLQAQILAAQGRWAEARPLFHTAAAAPQAPEAAAIGEAEALQALGRTEEAALVLEKVARAGRATVLQRLRWAVLLVEQRQEREAREVLAATTPATPSETKWKQYAEGRLLLLQDQAAPALRIFTDLLAARESLPEALQVAAIFGETEARLVLQGTQEADDVLETFIWRNASSSFLDAAFRRLDQIYAQEENPSEVELRKWSQKPQGRRAALATFYLGKAQARERKSDKATATLERFLQAYPTHPLGAEACLLQAEVWTEKGQLAQAVRALENAMKLNPSAELRPTLELRAGLAHFQQGEYETAARLFDAAGQHTPQLRLAATFDAALAWLHLHQFDQFAERYRALQTQQPENPLRAELILEQGLVQARSRDPRAAETLHAFLRDFPRSPRRAEARLALAEVRFLAGKNAEGEMLLVANEAPPAPTIAAQGDYLAIFLSDARPDREDAKTIALARKFLEQHAAAPQAPEVRMKLGQVFFRREDYANAETQFATLADGPAGPYTEAATFLAGRSAVRLINPGAVDRALEFFDRVVKMDGAFKLYARQEQAAVQSRLEHEDQAIALYDLILSSPGVDPKLWQAAMCGKGDNLVTKGRHTLPETAHLVSAIAVYTQLATSPEIGVVWRNQALYKKAKALELLGRGEESLAAFYDVLNGPTDAEREYFWFYKAGFDAARSYEQQENWKSAIGIYQKIARLEGPRTAEAQSRLRQVRLEHFIWE